MNAVPLVSASRRKTHPATPAEICWGGMLEAQPTPNPHTRGRGSRDGATDSKMRQHLHCCSMFSCYF